jgi:hypothetical protein
MDVAVAANTGNIIFRNNNVKSSDANPRSAATVYLRFSLDTNLNGLVIPASIPSSPQLLLTFPSEYKLNFYNPTLSLVLKQYTQSQVDNTLAMTVLPTTNTRSGNNVFIALGTTLAIPATILYYDIEVSNIVSPIDNVPTPGTFMLALYNSDYSYMYRSVTNLNNMATAVLPIAFDPFDTNYRGIQYLFDNLKWIIDVYDIQNNANPINYISVSSGRFLSFQFKVRTSTIQPAGLTIFLAESTIFKTDIANYQFSSSISFTNFSLGASCNIIRMTLVYSIYYILYV